jgi:hypothetical protein
MSRNSKTIRLGFLLESWFMHVCVLVVYFYLLFLQLLRGRKVVIAVSIIRTVLMVQVMFACTVLKLLLRSTPAAFDFLRPSRCTGGDGRRDFSKPRCEFLQIMHTPVQSPVLSFNMIRTCGKAEINPPLAP